MCPHIAKRVMDRVMISVLVGGRGQFPVVSGQEPEAIDKRILMSEPSSRREREGISEKWTCDRGNRSHSHVTGRRRIFVWFFQKLLEGRNLGERELGEPNKVKR